MVRGMVVARCGGSALQVVPRAVDEPHSQGRCNLSGSLGRLLDGLMYWPRNAVTFGTPRTSGVCHPAHCKSGCNPHANVFSVVRMARADAAFATDPR